MPDIKYEIIKKNRSAVESVLTRRVECRKESPEVNLC
jgi:hypothetical protein